MMTPVFSLPCAIVLSCAKSLLYRGVSAPNAGKRGFWAVNTLSFSVSACILTVFAVLSGSLRTPSCQTVLLAIPFALITLAAQVFYIRAQHLGTVSLNTFLYSCGFIIPVLYSIIRLREPVKVLQISGLFLLLCTLYVYLLPQKTKVNGKWLTCILAASLCSGLLGILQKVQQNTPYAAELDGFLVVSFLLCAVLSGIFYFISRRGKERQSMSLRLSERVFAVCVGIVAALLNRVNLSLAGALPGMIFYPVFNGSVTLLSGITSYLVYREKMNVRQWISLCLGIAAIALIAL